MRSPALLLSCLMLLPGALATHDAERDLTGEVAGGSSIIMALEASGSITSTGEGTERRPNSIDEVTHSSVWTYSWGGTLQLDLQEDGTLSGGAQLTGGGSGRLHDQGHFRSYDGKGGVLEEVHTTRDCKPRVGMSLGGNLGARAVMDKSTGDLFVLITAIGETPPAPDCTLATDTDHTETYRMYPSPSISPLAVEGIQLTKGNDARLGALDPGMDEEFAAGALIFSVPLDAGHTILRGGRSASLPVSPGSSPLGHICPPVPSEIVKGTCTAAGTLQVRILVDPCPVAKASRDVHLAAVKALKQPASGSSESQVRAFQVDVRQKVSALLADERVLQLMCTDDGDSGTLAAVEEAGEMVVEAWADVAKDHGLSDEGKRDLLAAERARQLLGGSEAGAASAELIGAVTSSPGEYGAFSVKAHSPVALHAWDEQGRHVGWNATTNASDVQIEGANYTGEPGGAQELTLPSGFYKVATVELGAGRYTLNSGWNGTAGEGFELLPLKSAPGRTLVSNYLLDHHGLLVGPTQRIATKADASFAFVDAWAPLPGDAATQSQGHVPNEQREGAAAETPPVAVPLVLVAIALVAFIGRRLS